MRSQRLDLRTGWVGCEKNFARSSRYWAKRVEGRNTSFPPRGKYNKRKQSTKIPTPTYRHLAEQLCWDIQPTIS